VKTTREVTWDELENGELIEAAFNAGFEVLISIDKKIEHEQNLANLPLPIIVLDSLSNSMEYLVAFVTAVTKLLGTSLTPALYWIASDGSVQRLTSPR
jgi:hypothetical protein